MRSERTMVIKKFARGLRALDEEGDRSRRRLRGSFVLYRVLYRARKKQNKKNK